MYENDIREVAQMFVRGEIDRKKALDKAYQIAEDSGEDPSWSAVDLDGAIKELREKAA